MKVCVLVSRGGICGHDRLKHLRKGSNLTFNLKLRGALKTLHKNEVFHYGFL